MARLINGSRLGPGTSADEPGGWHVGMFVFAEGGMMTHGRAALGFPPSPSLAAQHALRRVFRYLGLRIGRFDGLRPNMGPEGWGWAVPVGVPPAPGPTAEPSLSLAECMMGGPRERQQISCVIGRRVRPSCLGHVWRGGPA